MAWLELLTHYCLALGSGLSKVASKVLRIGHLGDLNELMCLATIAGAETAMRDIGIAIELGSGVAADQFYRGKERSAVSNT